MIDQLASTKISAEDLREFSQCGFLVVNRFLEESMVHQLVTAVELLDTEEGSSRIRRGVVFARRNLLELSFVRALIGLPRVIEILDAIAPGLKAVRAILFDKTGSANWTVPWHQDRSIAVRKRINVLGFGPWSKKAGVVHVQPPAEILRNMVTLRFQLDACGLDNGPLRVIGETHESIWNHGEVEARVADGEQTNCTTLAGGLIVMRPLVLHASSPAIKPGHRRVIHVEFGQNTLPGGLEWVGA